MPKYSFNFGSLNKTPFMKKALRLLLFVPLALFCGCGDDPAPAGETIDCQASQFILSASGFQPSTVTVGLNGNKITSINGAGLAIAFTHAGDSVTYISNNRKEVAFSEGGKVVRHEIKPANPGTGARIENRILGTFVYNGSQLTKVVYKNYNFSFGPTNNSISTTQLNSTEYTFKYDASGNLTAVDHTLIPAGGGAVPNAYKTMLLTYTNKAMPRSGTVPFFNAYTEIFESYVLAFNTQIKLFKNIPATFGYTDRSQNPVQVGAFTYTPTVDAAGNITKLLEVTTSRTFTYDYTYKCP